MSDFDAAVAEMDETLFTEFGDDATVQRGADAPVALRVFVERGVEKIGDFGQVVARVTKVTFRNSDWQPLQGDVVTLGGGARAVDSVETDDGYATSVVLHG